MRKFGYMRWVRIWLLGMLPLLTVFNIHSQELSSPAAWSDLYRKAGKFYNAAEPTEITDSLALQAYQQVIQLLAVQQVENSPLFDSYVKSGILLTGQKKMSWPYSIFSGIHPFKRCIPPNSRFTFFFTMAVAGSNYYNLFDFDSALVCYKRAEQLLNDYIQPAGNRTLV